MIRNYIQIAFRNFLRQKSYTILNVAGLSLGLAASLLIIQYVKYERSFDRFHSRADDIYRIQYNLWKNGVLNFESAVAVPAAGPALKENFPEVEEYTRFLPMSAVITYDKPGEEPISYRAENGQFVDTSLFKVFDFKLIEGDPKTCLKGINKVILSKSMSTNFFGNENAIGKRLSGNGKDYDLEVTGVFQDVPENSHIKFDFLISYETINARTENQSEESWGWYDFYTFVLLKHGTDVHNLQIRWDDYLAKARKEDWEKRDAKQEFILRPLTDIHLHSNLLYETSPEELRDGDSVYALSIIALFILIIAWVNYVNLATARSFKRANEVGVRKVVGAFKGQLVSQFLVESFLLNILAVLLAVVIVALSWPYFSALTGWNISRDFFFQKEFWLLLVILFVGGAILSGFYPAIVLSSFKPISVLKGKVIRSPHGNYLRKGLVIFQFGASVFLISGSLIVYQQLSYMKNKDLGIDIMETLVLQGPRVIDSLYNQKFEAFRTEVLRIAGVKGISSSSSIPGKENFWTRNIKRLTGGPESSFIVTHLGLDQEYVSQYGINIIAGRNFSSAFPNDDNNILINETLARDLEFETPQDAIGELVIDGGDTVEVIGVLADYHQLSLKAKVIPVVFRWFTSTSYYSLKLETYNYQKIITELEQPWEEFFPGNPLDYFFLDQYFDRQYETDDRFGKVFTVFTILAIFIASLGLLGLSAYMTVQRTKEVGIRKVLGSTVSGIIILLSKGFMQPVLLSVIIAAPLGWWLMNKWLSTFPYRTSIDPWIFVVSGLIVLIIAFVSVSSQTWKAASTKPSESLKHE